MTELQSDHIVLKYDLEVKSTGIRNNNRNL